MDQDDRVSLAKGHWPSPVLFRKKISTTTVFPYERLFHLCVMEPGQPTILPEYARINVSNPKQVSFWANHLGITEEQLRHVIFICGPIVKEIRQYLAACK